MSGVLGLVVPTRSFLDRFTPNLLGGEDIGTCFRGILSCSGLKRVFGTIRITKTGVDHFRIRKITFFLFVDRDIRLELNQVPTVVYNSHVDYRTKRFGLHWSIFDSFLPFVVLTLLEIGLEIGF